MNARTPAHPNDAALVAAGWQHTFIVPKKGAILCQLVHGVFSGFAREVVEIRHFPALPSHSLICVRRKVAKPDKQLSFFQPTCFFQKNLFCKKSFFKPNYILRLTLSEETSSTGCVNYLK